MPLPDGTNAEKEDVEPALGWTSKADITDVTLYEMHISPPCIKIRLLLAYHDVPFKTAGKKKKTDYKKVPVMDASGRQINDSYIIYKNLVPVLCQQPFDDTWNDKITYKLQPSIEAEAFMDNKGDMKKFLTKGAGVPGCIACCIAGHMGKKFGTGIRKNNPDMGKSVDLGKELFAEIGSKEYHGGTEPDQVDLAYYGTLLAFDHCGTQACSTHLQDTGLGDWFNRMKGKMPDVMVKKK